ncbi:MAG: hypothetical protein PF447_08750, partial [Spirochaetaceae bacterium]|jgi:hypothetical protein|nr:hypothetical protein [Spirochaetaceae bacterium]
MPENVYTQDIKDELLASGGNWLVESLYEMELPVLEENMSSTIYNKISAVSTMEGILYYSGKYQSMWPLIEEAWITNEKGSRSVIEDPEFSRIPTERTIVFYQKDIKFGGNYYQADYYIQPGVVRLSITNLTTLRYRAFPLMRPEKLRSEILILWDDEKLWFYGLTCFDFQNTFGLISERLLQNAFDYRMSALQGWFVDSVYQ